MEKLDKFKLFLIRRGKSTGTVEKHLGSIKTVLANVESLDPDKIDNFIVQFLQKGRKKEYLNVIIQALRAWGEFVDDDRYKKIKYFSVNPEESHKATLSDEEIKAIYGMQPHAGNGEFYNNIWLSFNLYFKVLAFTGMRPGEAAALTVDAIDFGRMEFDLTQTKTNIPRRVPINPILKEELEDYVKKLTRNELFVNTSGKQIVRDNWKYHFSARIKRLGIKRKDLSTNSLRHTFITRQLDEDKDLKKLQYIVGHRKITTTARYEHLATNSLHKLIKEDRLGIDGQSYEDRLKKYMDENWTSLEKNALNMEEKKKMLKDLISFLSIKLLG